jgi:GlcNAc-P-P-Und epimerase
MNRVFVTGGSGFIGTNLVNDFRNDQIEVLNYDVRPPIDTKAARCHVTGDILDVDRLIGVLMDFKPDMVVHLAARCDLAGKTVEEYAANTTGVRQMISAVNSIPSVSRTIFASSRYVHANEKQPDRDDDYSPFTMYGASKAEGEKIVRTSDMGSSWIIIRPTSIWGPWFDIPYKGFFEAVRRGLYLHPRGESIYKSYGFVGNVVHQIRKLLTAPVEAVHGRTLYAADYAPIEVGKMAETIRHHFGAPPVRQAPLSVMKTIALAGDALRKAGWYNPPLTSFRLSNLRCQMIYDISSTAQAVGSLPYSTEDGVIKTVQWMKGHV